MEAFGVNCASLILMNKLIWIFLINYLNRIEIIRRSLESLILNSTELLHLSVGWYSSSGGSCYSSSMRCPVKFEISILSSRNSLAVQSLKDFFCCVSVIEFNESIAYWVAFHLISYKLHVCNSSNIIKLFGYIIFWHPRLHIAYP